MTVQTLVQGAASGSNTTTHVVTAASLGTGLSETIQWVLQLEHLDPPAQVAMFITGVSMVVVSWIMQRLA